MQARINEHDEFLLSRLLDGDLAAEEADALRARLEREPELQAAYDALRRIDEALESRRKDQPDVDFRAFHANVMQAVEAEAGATVSGKDRETGGVLLKFPSWFKVATPLAAAAALALVLLLNSGKPTIDTPTAQPGQGDSGTSSIAMTEGPTAKPALLDPTTHGGRLVLAQVSRPVSDSSGKIVVRVGQPAEAAPAERSMVQVSFRHCDELARLVEYKDQSTENESKLVEIWPSQPENKNREPEPAWGIDLEIDATPL